jgi:hypothetical protein
MRNALQFFVGSFVIGELMTGAAVAQSDPQPETKRFEFEATVFGGVNAPQVRLTGGPATYVSSGYSGSLSGFGFSVLPDPRYKFELDAVYTNRVFGFGSSKAFFNCFQFPVSVQLRRETLSLGAGVYGAVWRNGKSDNQISSFSEVAADEVGKGSKEYGFLGLLSIRQKILEIPFYLAFRYLRTESDIAKSSLLKGSLSEYQLLVGIDFDFNKRAEALNSSGAP